MHGGIVGHRIHLQKIGDVMVARILEYPVTAPNDHRNVFDGHMESIEQRLHTGIAVDIDALDAHLERARGAGSDDPILLLELEAADAAITRWLEHRPQEAGSITIAALARARSLAASIGPTEALEPRFQSAYERTLVLACVDAMQANEPEVILPLVDEMTRVAAGAGIEASLQASLRRGSALAHLGRLAEAEEQLGAAWQEARRAFLPGIALDIGSWLIQTSYMRGRLIEAQEVGDECEALAERIGQPSRPAVLARMWRLIATISAGEHRSALAGLVALCESERDPHHRIQLHQAIAEGTPDTFSATGLAQNLEQGCLVVLVLRTKTKNGAHELAEIS